MNRKSFLSNIVKAVVAVPLALMAFKSKKDIFVPNIDNWVPTWPGGVAICHFHKDHLVFWSKPSDELLENVEKRTSLNKSVFITQVEGKMYWNPCRNVCFHPFQVQKIKISEEATGYVFEL